jgi:hypothetical protein
MRTPSQAGMVGVGGGGGPDQAARLICVGPGTTTVCHASLHDGSVRSLMWSTADRCDGTAQAVRDCLGLAALVPKDDADAHVEILHHWMAVRDGTPTSPPWKIRLSASTPPPPPSSQSPLPPPPPPPSSSQSPPPPPLSLSASETKVAEEAFDRFQCHLIRTLTQIATIVRIDQL